MTKNRPFDAVLFDLEGTLVDFQWRLDDAVKEILPVLVAAGIDLDQYGKFPVYTGLYNTSRKITKNWPRREIDRLFEKLAAIYDKYDKDALSRWAPYPDVNTVLKKLSILGYRMAVVTNCGTLATNTVLERFSLAGYFEIILSRNDVSFLKPSPEGLNLAREKLRVPVDRALFVGDSVNDILAADKLSMPSCFLSCGESLLTGKNAPIANFQIATLSGLFDLLSR